MTTKSVFMKLIVALIFDVAVSLNASNTKVSFFQENMWPSVPHHWRPSLLMLIGPQPLGWQVTIIPLGSCCLSSFVV
jgi:hypothetical protein